MKQFAVALGAWALVAGASAAQGLPADVAEAYRAYSAALEAGDAAAAAEHAQSAWAAARGETVDADTRAALATNAVTAADAAGRADLVGPAALEAGQVLAEAGQIADAMAVFALGTEAAIRERRPLLKHRIERAAVEAFYRSDDGDPQSLNALLAVGRSLETDEAEAAARFDAALADVDAGGEALAEAALLLVDSIDREQPAARVETASNAVSRLAARGVVDPLLIDPLLAYVGYGLSGLGVEGSGETSVPVEVRQSWCNYLQRRAPTVDPERQIAYPPNALERGQWAATTYVKYRVPASGGGAEIVVDARENRGDGERNDLFAGAVQAHVDALNFRPSCNGAGPDRVIGFWSMFAVVDREVAGISRSRHRILAYVASFQDVEDE